MLQHTHLAVLLPAGDILDLPFQRPALDVPDDIHDFKPALSQGVFGPDRERGDINRPRNDLLLFQLLQPLGQDLRGDAGKGVAELGEPPRVPDHPCTAPG